jgi:hypothetical protein
VKKERRKTRSDPPYKKPATPSQQKTAIDATIQENIIKLIQKMAAIRAKKNPGNTRSNPIRNNNAIS